MSNIVVELKEKIQQGTRMAITDTDIGHVLGYGRTQIYEATANGKLNTRLARAALLAIRLVDQGGPDALFGLIPKLAEPCTGSKSQQIPRINKIHEEQIEMAYAEDAERGIKNCSGSGSAPVLPPFVPAPLAARLALVPAEALADALALADISRQGTLAALEALSNEQSI